jgi:hypothetical protein
MCAVKMVVPLPVFARMDILLMYGRAVVGMVLIFIRLMVMDVICGIQEGEGMS